MRVSWFEDGEGDGSDDYGLIPGEEYNNRFDQLRTANWADWFDEDEVFDRHFLAWEPEGEPWYVVETGEKKHRQKVLRKLRKLEEQRVPRDVFNGLFLDKLDSPEGRAATAAFGGSYIRDHLREVAFSRNIIPPSRVVKSDVALVNRDALVTIEEIEPESRAMAINMRGRLTARVIRAPQDEVPFFSISPKRFEEYERELLSYRAKRGELMETINRIEDLPPEMQDTAHRHLLLYGNVFIYNTEKGPVLLDPVKLTTLQVPKGAEYGTPAWLPHVKALLDNALVDKEFLRVVDADGNQVKRQRFEAIKEEDIQRKIAKDWHLAGRIGDTTLLKGSEDGQKEAEGALREGGASASGQETPDPA